MNEIPPNSSLYTNIHASPSTIYEEIQANNRFSIRETSGQRRALSKYSNYIFFEYIRKTRKKQNI